MWRVEDRNARLTLPHLSAALDTTNPLRGLGEISVHGKAVAAEILQIALPADAAADFSTAERYTRGGDFVATYAETEAWPFRMQFYWRGASHHAVRAQPAIAAIELVASVQTQLLDSQARLAARSRLIAGEVLRLRDASRAEFELCDGGSPHQSLTMQKSDGPACFLLRLDENLSYAEMVHPLDQRVSRLSFEAADQQTRATLNHELFVSRLEKGVILRSRVLGLFLPRAGDQAAVAEHYAAFAAAEPPLTT